MAFRAPIIPNMLLLTFSAECKSECLNGGTCNGPDYCACPSNFTGAHCEFGMSNYSLSLIYNKLNMQLLSIK